MQSRPLPDSVQQPESTKQTLQRHTMLLNHTTLAQHAQMLCTFRYEGGFMVLLMSLPAYGGISEMDAMAATRQRNPLCLLAGNVFRCEGSSTHSVRINSRSKYPPRNGMLPMNIRNVPTMDTIMDQCQVVISMATMSSSLSTSTV